MVFHFGTVKIGFWDVSGMVVKYICLEPCLETKRRKRWQLSCGDSWWSLAGETAWTADNLHTFSSFLELRNQIWHSSIHQPVGGHPAPLTLTALGEWLPVVLTPVTEAEERRALERACRRLERNAVNQTSHGMSVCRITIMLWIMTNKSLKFQL